MVCDWLSPPPEQFVRYGVLEGEIPDAPTSCDLWVITGSRFAVYEDHDWIPSLEAFIRSVRDAQRKMIGICYGRQIIAQALGGVRRMSRWGWALGVQECSIVDWPKSLGTAPEYLAI